MNDETDSSNDLVWRRDKRIKEFVEVILRIPKQVNLELDKNKEVKHE